MPVRQQFARLLVAAALDQAKFDRETSYKDLEFQREANLKRELAAMKGGMILDPDTNELVPNPNGSAKPLPVGALKMQDDALEALGGANTVAAETARLSKLVKDGVLELGPVTNTTSRLRNFAGMSSPASQNYADMTTSLETIRNNTLLLHKGVQTEGDAIRAMNQVTATRNDPVAFAQAMDKLNKINQQAAALQKNRINSVRQNYGAPQYDFGNMGPAGQATMPPAVPTPGADSVPQGGTLVGTSGGKKVFKLPNGQHIMEQ